MDYKSDIEIAQEAEMLPIMQVAKSAGIDEKYVEQYGKYKAKIDYANLAKNGKGKTYHAWQVGFHALAVEKTDDNCKDPNIGACAQET